MRSVSATEASGHFSDLLGAVERGETVTVTRDGRPVAEMRPLRPGTGADLRSALSGIPAPDEKFAEDIAVAVRLLRPGRHEQGSEAV
ncbi:type II toxin-antitoxin system Phd/YefM family antitoxin [Paractinoplanes aksuensis]|uniref:type II toxin-antitoxin system Phd/YefM family antitoxin n=1 Tax=Paractinoplanes aksuensis TaxID=2939490 RepID=UPI0034DAECCB